mmetsp:Transcript_15910/g.30095  ORF Transcript_15910/g.30095 Transcript_15910/m.30095 type:complete len:99 (+) Transcript_15910:152-448(+)|eukprot:CAMPEP_0197437868 /NCGR_PEP_ID=MMETSP1175-20131217/5006_1 /TAXON_ID=1003142 /ORGANISM="Triceratium dubium, Strain CCMP147" /LENGTH=98 /DNA_ID=CAMNT_0042967491 /DNA_START=53 /DNA_END=349 /DNA_ORIENTATION=-
MITTYEGRCASSQSTILAVGQVVARAPSEEDDCCNTNNSCECWQRNQASALIQIWCCRETRTKVRDEGDEKGSIPTFLAVGEPRDAWDAPDGPPAIAT